MSDAIIFALLFATYVGDGAATMPAGRPGATCSALPRTFGETMLLLFSSATFGFATLAAWARSATRMLSWLLVTFVLGLGFVAMEIRNSTAWSQAGAGPDRSGFLSAFFTLVGTHGLHVSVGLIWILVVGGQVMVKGLTAPVASRALRLGLFWHFLDIVWVGIFSVVYLPGVL